MSKLTLFALQNKPTGDCYVQMKSEDSAKKASTDLNKEYIGSRYIEVFQVRIELCQ